PSTRAPDGFRGIRGPCPCYVSARRGVAVRLPRLAAGMRRAGRGRRTPVPDGTAEWSYDLPPPTQVAATTSHEAAPVSSPTYIASQTTAASAVPQDSSVASTP